MAKLKLPAEIEEQLLTRRNGGQRLGRCRARSSAHQCGGASPRGAGHQGRRGKSQTGREQIAAGDSWHGTSSIQMNSRRTKRLSLCGKQRRTINQRVPGSKRIHPDWKQPPSRPPSSAPAPGNTRRCGKFKKI